MTLPIGNDFEVRHWLNFDFGIHLKMKILTPSNLYIKFVTKIFSMFFGTRNSNMAFILSLDAFVFYKNLYPYNISIYKFL